jgi:predicted nucleic acid-binding Zn ribbon protein
MSRSREPRGLGAAVRTARDRAAPATLLAAVQSAWAEAAGPGVAAEAEPVAERDGVVTVACRSAAWAQELDLLQRELVARLEVVLARRPTMGGLTPLRGLRFTADAARHFYS